MLARHIGAKIVVDNVDITLDVSPYVKTISYEDVLIGETDSAQIEFIDRDKLFLGDWFPTRGSTLSLELIKTNWQGDSLEERLPLGLFEIDELQNQYPPWTARVKANSCPQNSALRQTDKSQSWENVKLSEICAEIAKEAGVELFFEAAYDPDINRAEMSEQSPLAFLEKICKDNFLALRFSDGKLIVFDEAELERQEPVMTLTYDTSIIKKFSAQATLTEIYKSCELNYKENQQSELYKAKVEDPSKESGKVLKINQKVSTQAEADRLALNKLREKNKDEVKVSLTCIGDFRLLAGSVIVLKGFGWYDGRYLIEKSRHEVGSGYDVNVELRRCLPY